MRQKYPFWKPFIALSVLGLIGTISLLFTTLPQLDQIIDLQPELAELPIPLLAIILLLQPMILLLIANVIGCLVAVWFHLFMKKLLSGPRFCPV